MISNSTENLSELNRLAKVYEAVGLDYEFYI
ncbi:hypothetical protein B0H39_004674 [Clostridium beijerinckii]|nr:hypothetical protein [Clostridium beijerinckii]